MSSPVLVFLAVYGASAGRGFVRDDYAWVLHSELRSWADVYRVLATDLGFYRPMVGLTFGVDEWLFGWDATGYGLTNVLLALGCCWAISSLARALGLPRGAAALAGLVWLAHPSFLPVSVLWVSGRTALLMILGSAASAAALLRGRIWQSLAWLAVALFSKEEAVLLPIVLFTWLWMVPAPPVRPMKWAFAAGGVEALYLLARLVSGATNPLNAPAFYRFTFDPAIVAGNLVWYTLHSLWPMLVAGLLAWIVLRPARRWSPASPCHREILLFSALWLVASVLLTMWLPVRSRLYLALPAAAASLAVASMCGGWWRQATRVRRHVALAAVVVFVAAMTPAHVRGAREWKTRAGFSATILEDLATLTAGLPEGVSVVLADDRNDPHGNLASVFGTMAAEAAVLASGRALSIWIEPAAPHAGEMGLRPPCPGCAMIRLHLVDGRLRRLLPSP